MVEDCYEKNEYRRCFRVSATQTFVSLHTDHSLVFENLESLSKSKIDQIAFWQNISRFVSPAEVDSPAPAHTTTSLKCPFAKPSPIEKSGDLLHSPILVAIGPVRSRTGRPVSTKQTKPGCRLAGPEASLGPSENRRPVSQTKPGCRLEGPEASLGPSENQGEK